ncbi:antibiotic biosynthesis monooxygenase, partial [Mesorhizobium sp. M7D.F.Ca.US.004.03.1.1]
MIAVLFEVEPAAGRRDAYLSIAADLRPLLDGIDGFVSIE